MSDVTEVEVLSSHYQYYVRDPDGDFDPSTVDYVNDGLLAPASSGARVDTGVHTGTVRVTVTVTDDPIPWPPSTDVVAATCSLYLERGSIIVESWDGPDAAFDRQISAGPVRCWLYLEVHGRDDAYEHQYDPTPGPVERHLLTISTAPMDRPRRRTRIIDEIGSQLCLMTSHID